MLQIKPLSVRRNEWWYTHVLHKEIWQVLEIPKSIQIKIQINDANGYIIFTQIISTLEMWFLPHQVQLDYLDLTRGVYSISMCSVAQYKYQTIPMDLRVGLACHGCKEYYPQARNGGEIIPSMKELSLWTFGWDGSIVTIRNITHRPGMVGWLFPQWKKVDKVKIGTLFPPRGGGPTTQQTIPMDLRVG